MPTAVIPNSSSEQYNTSNQVTYSSLNSGNGLTYDAAGDVTFDGLNSYLYDAEGRICAVKNSVGNITGYVYDAAGIRVAKGVLTGFSCNFAATGGNGFTANTSWALGQGGEQVTEYTGSASASTWKHSNVVGSGKLIGTYDTAGLHFYLDDWLGTRRIQTNSTGQLEMTCQSLPYGNGEKCIPTTLGTAEDPTEQHFTGKERDTESGNDYFGARYYSSAAGRFLSPDWSAKEEPVPYANLGDPQTLNLYAYVRNNPMSLLDLDGHEEAKCEFDCQAEKNWITSHEIGNATQGQLRLAQLDNLPAAGAPELLTSGSFAQDSRNTASFYTAIYYLEQSPEMSSAIGDFMKHKFTIRFSDKEVGDYEGFSGIIRWNPSLGLTTNDGKQISPAMVLGHEIAHSVGGHVREKLMNMPDRNYDNKEERRVIRNYENPAARELGEGIRHDHHSGQFVHVDSVIEH